MTPPFCRETIRYPDRCDHWNYWRHPMARNTSRVVGIDHISIRVSDYKKSRAFYSRLFDFLGFELSEDYGTTIGWTNGQTRYWIAPAEGRKSYRIGDVGFHHYAFQLRSRKEVDALQ